MDVPKKYSGLRFLALLIKIVAWLALILSIAVAVWFWIQGDKVAGLRYGGQNWTGALFLPFGLYTFVQLYIIGALISLFTDVEYNTRANAMATARLISLMGKMEERMAKSAPAVMTSPPPPPPPPPAPDEQPTPPEPTRPVQPIEENAPAPPPPPTPEKFEEHAQQAVEGLTPESIPEPEITPEVEPAPEPPAMEEGATEGD